VARSICQRLAYEALTCSTPYWLTPLVGSPHPQFFSSPLPKIMAPPHLTTSPQKKGRMALAVHSIQNNPNMSIRKAEKQYRIAYSSLRRELQGLPRKRHPHCLLSLVEEEKLVQWILDIDHRAFSVYLIDVRQMAQTLIDHYGHTNTC
jgi:hypothetical protein